MTSSISPWLASGAALSVLLGGAWVAAVLDELIAAWTAGFRSRAQIAKAFVEPLREAALMLRQQTMLTERPDTLLWAIAPAAYAALAALALSVVPLGERLAIADVRTGIVLFGAAEALAIVAIFLHGWAPNSVLPLIGGYRFVAVGLSYELLSMFVLIGAALPAQSLSVFAVVEAQAEVWNVVRQPLGLPLWIVVTLGVSFWGPMNVADSRDVCGGTAAEASGRQRLLWEVARRGMLTVFCAMGAATFLGGWHGPLLSGWAWMIIKTIALLLLVLWIAQRVGRVRTERMVPLLWTVLLPLAFVDLGWAGIEALS